jgi:protein-S-isoprenylcysteine O-methyltransferase Ste14
MHTSVLLNLVYDKEQAKWVFTDAKKRPLVAQHLEISVWSIVSLSLLVVIASLFVSHTPLDSSTAVMLTTLYSFTCMLISNEFMLSDWHTDTG